MNPRGRQYALGGTVSAWTRLETLTTRQRRALRTAYSGMNPMVYSRYGHRQWTAPLPSTRVIVKDPFAMLSLATLNSVTGSRAVLLFRHPGAALASYRRMGWSPDTVELGEVTLRFISETGGASGVEPAPDTTDQVDLMAWFWSTLYGIALYDADRLGSAVTVLAHEDVASGGAPFGRSLFEHLELEWSDEVDRQLARGDGSGSVNQSALHNFDRAPAKVAHEWEARISPDERRRLEVATSEVHSALRSRAFRPDR